MRFVIDRATHSLSNNPAAKALLVTLLIATAARTVLYQPPNVVPDTHDYLVLAHCLRALRFASYDGSRTPVYSLFLLLAGINFYAVCVLQNILGIAIVAMLFAMVYFRTRSWPFALITGIGYGLDLSPLPFEHFIMSETLCTFLLTLSVLVFQLMVLKERFGWRQHAVLGILIAITGLTRPLYVCLAPLFLVMLAVMRPPVPVSRTDRIQQLVSFAAPAGTLLLGWCLFNWLSIGYFGFTTLIGFSLTNQSGAFIELAPDKYASVRDPYLKAREEQIKQTGTYAMAIFRAAPEIDKNTGYDRVQLTRELTKMSLELFVAHPIRYAAGVLRAWVRFWQPPLYWRSSSFFGEIRARPLFLALAAIEILTLALANFVFLLSSANLLRLFLVQKPQLGFDACVMAIVLTVSVVQALLEFGDNSRYSVPTAPLVLYTVMVSFWHFQRGDFSTWSRKGDRIIPDNSRTSHAFATSLQNSLRSQSVDILGLRASGFKIIPSALRASSLAHTHRLLRFLFRARRFISAERSSGDSASLELD